MMERKKGRKAQRKRHRERERKRERARERERERDQHGIRFANIAVLEKPKRPTTRIIRCAYDRMTISKRT